MFAYFGSVNMEIQSTAKWFGFSRLMATRLLVMAFGLFAAFAAAAASVPLSIHVVGVTSNGTQVSLSNDYRWTVEEDATKLSIPGQPATAANYSFSFHTSYMPVVAAGRVGTFKAVSIDGSVVDPDVKRLYEQGPPDLDTGKRYYVSVAAEGYQMGGAPVVFNALGTAASATVYVNKYNLPAAQVSVFAFNDNNPINGAPDLPQEQGLPGFTVQLFEAGGTYGQSGGAVTQDGFGNPLGTTYDENGQVLKKGSGIVLTGPDGTATIKNLFPAKYTVVIVPPVNSDWHQTSTIEGTRGSDAWVKNNEPAFFQEFGPPGHHVFIGFTRSGKLPIFRDTRTDPTTPCAVGISGCSVQDIFNGGHTISGRIVNVHNSRTPNYAFEKGAPVPECWVGLNETNGSTRALYATPCKKDSTFSIPQVPDGNYELVVWDDPLDMIIATQTVCLVRPPRNGQVVPAGCSSTDLAMGDVPVFSWFGRYQGRVFQDIDGTGLPFFAQPFDKPYIKVDPVTGIETEVTKAYATNDLKPAFGEGVASNIRFRDGSIYQSAVTKQDGTFAFTELFPFFNWMVAEIDYARFKATGATMIADGGGVINSGANETKLWKAETGSYGSNDPAFAYNPWIRLNPQLQGNCTDADVASNTKNGKIIDFKACFKVGQKYYRTENCTGNNGQCAILLEGMQTFLGQTNHIEWGKQPYAGQLNGTKSENGGIAGIVHYAITRAEDDPRFATAENWEPGIPHVQVNLFLDCDGDGKPDNPLNDGTGRCSELSSEGYQYDQPDVDNFPFCWRDPESCGLTTDTAERGQEDIKRSRTGGTTFSLGDIFQWGGALNTPVTVGLGTTDSWDDSAPNGCVKAATGAVGNGGIPFKDTLDCFDGLYNFNQLRPSVFDGGYAFGRVAGQPELPVLIGAVGKGTYIVEAVAPPGYLHQGNGDKNVTFGDALQASVSAMPFPCVGMELDVPEFLTLFPDAQNDETRNPNYSAGAKWNKCDMKAVPLMPGTNPAPDFFMFTEAPVAGHGVGFILDDTATEFNRFAPTFGEKYAPPHLPVSVQDWTGREISRVYSDQFGSYNFLVPSSFTINPPFPSGVMPSMMVSCMNHPGPIQVLDANGLPVPELNGDGLPRLDASGKPIFKMQIDPYFNRKYTQFCYTLQYLPGKTTYLDTPVLPIAAFANVEKNPLDCECQDKTPAIYSVNNPDASTNSGSNGPWVPATGGTLTVVSMGSNVEVPNPAYDPNPTCTGTGCTPPAPLPKLITRDYGFGDTRGTVMLGDVNVTADAVWTKDLLTIKVPAGLSNPSYQLKIIRNVNDGGKETVAGLTVHVGGNTPKVVAPGASIQTVIDNAPDGSLITIPPGIYNEYLILDKRVRLQGWGAGAVTINAAKQSAGGLGAWRALLNFKVDARCAQADGTTAGLAVPSSGCKDSPLDPDTGEPTVVAGPNATFSLLPGQTLGMNRSNNEPILFGAEEGAGILVVGKSESYDNGKLRCASSNAVLRIDGLTVTGSDSGGGILASGYNCGLKITNNRVVANYGTYGGGIRVGHTALTSADTFTNGLNDAVEIDHNWISQNGASEIASGDGGGGGVTLGTGSNGYKVSNNYVCGNFSMSDGGGISHVGKSDGVNWITNNKILLNQTFNQSADPTGGGLFIGGQVPVGGGSSDGTGDINVDRNLIQYNHAGAGAGGGVSIARTNSKQNVVLTNNMIVNNATAYAGGGLAVAEVSSDVRLVNNTVADNVSTATNRQSFPSGTKTQSNPQVAGIALLSGSSPTLLNNIVWGNKSYIWTLTPADLTATPPRPVETTKLTLATAQNALGVWDLGVFGNSSHTALSSDHSVLTRDAGNNTNNGGVLANATQVAFVKPIGFAAQTDTDQPVVLPETTIMQTALTFDEGGNFINVNFSPLTPWDLADPSQLRADYHIADGSVSKDAGQNRSDSNKVPTRDYDLQARASRGVDIGADELIDLPPSIAITAPVNNATVIGNVTISATVTNGGPVQRVQFLVNGLTVASDTSAPYSASWSTAFADNGTKVITALACGNTSGTCDVLATSADVNVTVNNPRPIVLTAPLEGATVSGKTVTLAATLEGLSGVNRVQFLLGNTVIGFDQTSPYSITWDSTSVANGAAVLTARACGNNSCSTVLATSAPVNVTIANGAASFSPSPFAFGDVLDNSTTTKTVTLTNVGAGPLSITSAAVTGSGTGWGFTKTASADQCSGKTLAATQTCTIDVTFHQNISNTSRAGQLTITDNGNGAHSVALSGR
jgi:hypothetical protein